MDGTFSRPHAKMISPWRASPTPIVRISRLIMYSQSLSVPQLQRFPSSPFSPILPQPFGKLSPSESLFGEGGLIQSEGLKEKHPSSAPLLAIDLEELFRTREGT